MAPGDRGTIESAGRPQNRKAERRLWSGGEARGTVTTHVSWWGIWTHTEKWRMKKAAGVIRFPYSLQCKRERKKTGGSNWIKPTEAVGQVGAVWTQPHSVTPPKAQLSRKAGHSLLSSFQDTNLGADSPSPLSELIFSICTTGRNSLYLVSPRSWKLMRKQVRATEVPVRQTPRACAPPVVSELFTQGAWVCIPSLTKMHINSTERLPQRKNIPTGWFLSTACEPCRPDTGADNTATSALGAPKTRGGGRWGGVVRGRWPYSRRKLAEFWVVLTIFLGFCFIPPHSYDPHFSKLTLHV